MPSPSRRLPAHLLLRACAAAIVLALAGCGGGGGNAATPPPPVQAATLTLSAASSQSIAGGKPLALTAQSSDGAAVSWQLAAGSPGSLSASSGASVSYTPPAAGAGAGATSVTITASSGALSKSITLTLYPDPGQPRLALVAGDDGGAGLLDGTGAQARYANIAQAVADGAGNLYTAESLYNRAAIRKTTPAGVVSTLLGSTPGMVDGDRATARLAAPRSLALGRAGSVYFVDAATSGLPTTAPIRRLDADGSVRTIANISLVLGDTLALVSDAAGTLYAVQQQHISVVADNGGVRALAGAPGVERGQLDGAGAAARFYSIDAATVDGQGNLYVLDHGVLRKVSPAGVVSSVAGAADGLPSRDGVGAAARFSWPFSLTVDGAGNILLLDTASGDRAQPTLRTVTPAGAVSSAPIKPVAGLPAVAAQIVAGANGALYLARRDQINTLAADGSGARFAGKEDVSAADVDGEGAAARFLAPRALAADLAGNLYVSDNSGPPHSAHQTGASGLYLRKISPGGTVSTLLVADQLRGITSMLTDRAGNLYVADLEPTIHVGQPVGGAIYKISPAGALSLLAGSTLADLAQSDGVGAAARFTMPTLEGIDADGNLYVSDRLSRRPDSATTVRKVTPAGEVSTIAALPAGIGELRDGNGNRYTLDGERGVVYQTTPGGVKTVLAGVLDQSATVGGALPGSLLNPHNLVATGPFSFALVSGSAVLKLVVPR